VLKIYRLLDRSARNQFSWYNTGIGTYVQSASFGKARAHESLSERCTKLIDQAFGSSLGDHVMAGYKFLMQYYSPEDEIYIFGFSRGAYTARFLAEMLDHIGLLSAGNEEIERFTWECFSKWKARSGDENDLYDFMKNFRETFCRPIRPIRFLGLFDTVNSVPLFENAWLQRTKFPYTAKTSAEIIRHAVSLGERRAKFRVDLVGASVREHESLDTKIHRYLSDLPAWIMPTTADERRALRNRIKARMSHKPMTQSSEPIPPPTVPGPRPPFRRRFSAMDRNQDILEVWFAGNHGDVGGGWSKHPSERWALSHNPLVWMVQEAQKAGLKFDPDKLVAMRCAPNKIDDYGRSETQGLYDALGEAETQGFAHDVLHFNQGASGGGVLLWKALEYLPFRRMDLQADGTWKPIRFPLPRGEVRDVPADAKIHGSVIRRMRRDETFRPGNLLDIGHGGRGKVQADASQGMGEWVTLMGKDDPVGEIFVSRKWFDEQAVRVRENEGPPEQRVVREG
jgi:uncharacterized protein (DUF2235 family)